MDSFAVVFSVFPGKASTIEKAHLDETEHVVKDEDNGWRGSSGCVIA